MGEIDWSQKGVKVFFSTDNLSPQVVLLSPISTWD